MWLYKIYNFSGTQMNLEDHKELVYDLSLYRIVRVLDFI